uniref:Uncharacterized protein n=1 Tax=Aegilops tauschii subsp. strangulata TaxID=200361 RepID=A0A453JQH6_AEGTS
MLPCTMDHGLNGVLTLTLQLLLLFSLTRRVWRTIFCTRTSQRCMKVRRQRKLKSVGGCKVGEAMLFGVFNVNYRNREKLNTYCVNQ